MAIKHKILIIEDNALLLSSLKEYLLADYDVMCVRSGKFGIKLISENNYDCVILDLYLKDCSGLEIINNLRSTLNNTPVIIMSGESAIAQKVILLDAGANDYIIKPFDIAELSARLRALIRKNPTSKAYKIVCRDLIIDTRLKRVTRGNVEIHLRNKEYGILECLAFNAGTVIQRTILMDYAWEVGHNAWPSTVNVHIKTLRDKMDRQYDKKLIITMRDGGYKLDSVKKITAI